MCKFDKDVGSPYRVHTMSGGNNNQASPDWFKSVANLTAQGVTVEFVAQGYSMWPAIRPGRDVVSVRAAVGYHKSDIVLAHCSSPAGIFLHRVKEVLPEGYLLMGDSNLYQTEKAGTGMIAGKVVGIARDGREYINTKGYRILTAIQELPAALRRLVVRIINITGRRI